MQIIQLGNTFINLAYVAEVNLSVPYGKYGGFYENGQEKARDLEVVGYGVTVRLAAAGEFTEFGSSASRVLRFKGEEADALRDYFFNLPSRIVLAPEPATCALCFQPLNGEREIHGECATRENMLAEQD